MIEYVVAALVAFAAALAAWSFRARRPGQDRVAQAVEQLASSSQAQQASVAALLEAARGQQGSIAQLQGSVAEHRQQVEGLKVAVEAAAQGLTEVKTQQGTSAARLQEARQLLERFDAESKERAARAQQAYDALGRLEAIISGTKSRGTAGENLLAEVIKQLPPEFRAYDVRIGGKTVEFAIPLPNGRYLPVDSKWTSVDKLEALLSCEAEERAAIVDAIQSDVEAKVDEVAKYLDPDKTCMMAVLAVPDAVYDLCARAHAEAHGRGVVIVGYGMAVPYVLSVLQVIHRFGARVDEAQLSQAVRTVLQGLDEMSEELEGRFAKGLTQLENARRALKGSVGKAQQALNRVQVEPGPNAHAPLPVEP